MKAATLPPLRVAPELRQAAEAVLRRAGYVALFDIEDEHTLTILVVRH